MLILCHAFLPGSGPALSQRHSHADRFRRFLETFGARGQTFVGKMWGMAGANQRILEADTPCLQSLTLRSAKSTPDDILQRGSGINKYKDANRGPNCPHRVIVHVAEIIDG